MLTNSRQKPGPKEADASAMCTFAHQAYWGFRFLSEERKRIWREVLEAQDVKHIQEIGRACSQPRAMQGAGYGARGLMTWLTDKNVAAQLLAAKRHRRFPRSPRPSSEDKRMIFLAIAVAAGVFGNEFSTALRKLAEAGYGEKFLSQKVHNFDRIEQRLRETAFVWAEPILNYCDHWPDDSWRLRENLPCPVPKDFHGGFIIRGYTSDGQLTAIFSKTLPTDLLESQEETEEANENQAVQTQKE